MSIHTPYITLTDDNFHREVLEAEIPVLVDCWATWCCPYRTVNSTISELAVDFMGQIEVGRLNVENSAQTAQSYRIRAVPTLLIFQGGEVVSQIVGGVSKEAIAAKLNALLQGNYPIRN